MQDRADGVFHISLAFTVTSPLLSPPELMLSKRDTPRNRQEVTIVGIGTFWPAQRQTGLRPVEQGRRETEGCRRSPSHPPRRRSLRRGTPEHRGRAPGAAS